jgi:hypothetical protein
LYWSIVVDGVPALSAAAIAEQRKVVEESKLKDLKANNHQKLCWKHKVLISVVLAVFSEEYSLLPMIEIHHQFGKFKIGE